MCEKIKNYGIMLIACLLFWTSNLYGEYGGGRGEPNDPYLIYTAEQINEIGLHEEDWGKHFKLMADIDLSSYKGTDFNIIGTIGYTSAFTGIFDGNGHTISNLSYTSIHRDYAGLFGFAVDAQIKDLGLIGFNIDVGTGDYAGSLVGGFRRLTGTAIIINCYTENCNISANNYVGGLVGYSDGIFSVIIKGCYSNGIVSGNDNIGGLVGINSSGSVSNSFSKGEVLGHDNVGGLAGYNESTISHCYSAANVNGSDCDIGGLAGYSDGMIFNCYSRGNVSGYSQVGGLVGSGGTIVNCYSVGSVSGFEKVGGLAGYNRNRGIINSFWDIETSGQWTSDGGFGRTTAEMQNPNTFIDSEWDFVGAPDGPNDIWAEPDGGGYPVLWWQLSIKSQLPAFSGGTGEPDDPYLISMADELNSIGHNPELMDAHFELIDDIDLAGIKFYIIGSQWYPFCGVFEGNGHTISNFSYSSSDADCVGLFGVIAGSQIKNIGLISPNIDVGRGDSHGCLVGYSDGGIITNCYVDDGRISGSYNVGALVGYNNGRITDCNALANVAGNECIGGLVGMNYGFRYQSGNGQDYVLSELGSIERCYSTGNVVGGDEVGGLVGENLGNILICYSNSSVVGERDASGGLVGKNNGKVMACYSNSNVNGRDAVGGLVGRNYDGQTVNCYAMGSVAGQWYVGGLVGSNTRSIGRYEGTIENCYSITVVLEGHQTGGLVGNNLGQKVTGCFWDIDASGRTTSYGGEGKTTVEMQMAETFLGAGWDFVDETANGTEDIWWIDEGRDYPRLWWESSSN
ncbi:MAG: hypothetical protein JW837_11010 [Sedimentisphaerales bacterium]|nr:hypothetical protein [Sedimentisphaerales bacterium]